MELSGNTHKQKNKTMNIEDFDKVLKDDKKVTLKIVIEDAMIIGFHSRRDQHQDTNLVEIVDKFGNVSNIELRHIEVA